MTLLLTDYLLAVYVVAGLVVAALLGTGIGSTGLTWAVRRATRQAVAQRDAALEQLALTEAALAAATHPVQHSADLPEVEEDLDAVARAVTDSEGRATPQPAPAVADPEAWVWDDHGAGPCLSLTADPVTPESPELYCEHPDGAGHPGRHSAHDGVVEWDDDGDMWVEGRQL